MRSQHGRENSDAASAYNHVVGGKRLSTKGNMKQILLVLTLFSGLAFGQTPWSCIGTLPASGTGILTCTSTPVITPITITSNTPPSGTVNVQYDYDLTATGGTPPYVWSITSGSLPVGLTLSPEPDITGTPTVAGTSNFTLSVADSANNHASLPLSITIAGIPPPSGGTIAANYLAYIVKYDDYATQLFVSPSGSGTACTATTPCSLATGLGKGGAGVVIWATDGNYPISTRIQTSLSGNSGAHAVFAAQHYAKAAIVFTPGSDNGWPLWYLTGSYVDIVGFDLSTTGSGNGNACGGIGTPGSSNNNTFEFNYIHDIPASTSLCGNGSGGGGIVFGSGTSGANGDIVANNVISNVGASGNQWTHGIYADGSGFNVFNNVIYVSSGAGVQCYHNCQSGSIVNNTLVGNKTFGIVAGSYGVSQSMSNVIMSNNIVVNSPVGIEVCDGNSCGAASGSGNVATNNLLFNNSSETKNITASNTISSDPLFVNNASPESGGNFALQSGSPAIGKALPTYAPAIDIVGNSRAVSPSIGAYQQ